jgi:hypothetical protein
VSELVVIIGYPEHDRLGRAVFHALGILIRPDICRSDHFGPFLGVVADERAELGCRHRDRSAAQLREPLFDVRVGEAGIDLAVELADDLA